MITVNGMQYYEINYLARPLEMLKFEVQPVQNLVCQE